MSLLSLVAALLLEQWRPLADRRNLYLLLARYATFLEGLFNAGEARQGAIAWVIAVVPAVLGGWRGYSGARSEDRCGGKCGQVRGHNLCSRNIYQGRVTYRAVI